MAKRIQSWEVSDAFWERVNPLIPQPERDKEKSYKRIAGVGRKPIPYRQVFEGRVTLWNLPGSFREGDLWEGI